MLLTEYSTQEAQHTMQPMHVYEVRPRKDRGVSVFATTPWPGLSLSR